MSPSTHSRLGVAGLALIAATSLAACSSTASTSTDKGDDAAASGDKPLICVDYPRSDTDFWNAFISYVPKFGKELDLNLKTTNSDNNVQKLVENVDACVAQGAKAIVMAPQDTAAIAPSLDKLAAAKIPVITLDTRPDAGDVYMVVRADNVAYGTKACEFLGEQMGGKGTAVELMGGQDSINGRDRAAGFRDCMTAKFPGIKISEQASEWSGDKAVSQLQTVLAADKDVRGVYMASSFGLAGTIQVLDKAGLLLPPTDPKHVFVISNDGIPQEYEEIRAGNIDATVNQPADLYAKFALMYANDAVNGKTYSPGPTDHGSNIIQVRDGVLEDQLVADLVTKDNVDDPNLWGNTLK